MHKNYHQMVVKLKSQEMAVKKLGRVGKDRPTGISLRRSLGFPDRENLRTLAPP